MDHPPLKIALLTSRASTEFRPQVFLDAAEPLVLTPAQRRVLVAVAIPPGLGIGGLAERSRWTTQDVLARANCDAATLSRAWSAMEQALITRRLEPSDYLTHEHGFYGTTRNVRVDVVELLLAVDDEREIDRHVAAWELPSGVRLPDEFTSLLSGDNQAALEGLLADAQRRRASSRPARDGQSGGPSTRARWIATLAAAVVVVAIALILLATLDSSIFSSRASGRFEVAGNTANTFSDYSTGAGTPGPPVPGHEPIRVSCRVRGLKVPNDHNPWWYRIGSSPWDGRYYASADAFYNTAGQSRGSLKGTKFVDVKVPLCG